MPVLAIGAVVLTGGAALGILPSVGSLAGSLGLSSTLTSVLVAGAKAATFGAVGAALTGGNIIKGATMGFAVGGALGGLGAALGGAGTAAKTAVTTAGGASQAGSTMAQGADAALKAVGATPGAAGSTAAGAAAKGLGTVASSVAAPVVSSAAPVASIAAPAVTAAVPASSGGVLGFLNQNPMVAAMGIQGLGAGISAKAQADEARKEREQIAANYGDTSGLYRLPAGQGQALPDAATKYNAIIGGKVAFDRNTGRIVPVGA